MRYILLVLSLLTLFSHCNKIKDSSKKNYFITANSPLLHYNGRVKLTDSAAVIYWAGTSINTEFYGRSIQVLIADEFGQNYFDIIIDSTLIKVIKLKQGKNTYLLAQKLKPKKHTLTIFKRNEYMQGRSWFYSLTTDTNGFFIPPQKNNITIEFYGNSITAGLANLDPKGKNFSPEYEDNYFAYGAITARNIKADYYCIARSGIGLTVSWNHITMPELFWRLNPEDSLSKWDFSKKHPDIVVINLFQNDYWLTQRPNHPEYKYRFGTRKPDSTFFINSYYKFIDTLTKIYPKTKIICTLGPMSAVKEGSPWKRYIEAGVKKLNNPNVYTFFFPYFVKQRHPTKEDHKIMAQMLTKFINQNIISK